MLERPQSESPSSSEIEAEAHARRGRGATGSEYGSMRAHCEDPDSNSAAWVTQASKAGWLASIDGASYPQLPRGIRHTNTPGPMMRSEGSDVALFGPQAQSCAASKTSFIVQSSAGHSISWTSALSATNSCRLRRTVIDLCRELLRADALRRHDARLRAHVGAHQDGERAGGKCSEADRSAARRAR